MLRKLFLLSALFLAIFSLSACTTPEYTVSFDSQGGSDVEDVVVEEGMTVAEPTAPTKADEADGSANSFVGWFTDAAGTTAYDFDSPVEEDLMLYAKWSLEVVLRFDTRTDAVVEPQLLGEDGGAATEPTAPTRDGYVFGGWFYTKRGLTWLEEEAIAFPLDVDETMTIYAYWEPVDSKAMNYGPEVTYTTSLDSSSRLILNPLVYEWSHEDFYIEFMSTPLYTTEVDWDKAIEDGVAEFPGDFSKIEAKEFSVEALDFVNILAAATNFPIDSEGEEHLTEDGKYDRDGAATIKDTEWTFKIREDLVFEDGTPITAADYEYTLKMFLDPLLLNYRANLYYKTETNKNGVPLVGAYEYFTGAGDWEDVGFEVVDDYTFTITLTEPYSQSQAVGFGAMPLVHEAAFEASMNAERTNAAYGTPAHPYVSYGEYILKSWDENQKLVFNKNYDYVLKGTVNYKSYVVQIVDNIDQRMELFANGDLSVAGLSQDYYAQYAESPNVFKSWDGYPQYLIVNLGPSKVENGNEQHEILFDARFRQALLYGFDRKYYATSVYAPNTASLLPVPLDTKSYNQDALYYSESPQHLAILDALGINPETEGYIPDKAVQLFNEAYNAWLADGNSGVVTLNISTDNDDFSLGLVEYIEEHYEDLFGEDKIDVVLSIKDPTAHRADLRNWNFDLSLNSIGFGSSVGVWWQYQAIAFYGDFIGGGGLGLSQPWDNSNPAWNSGEAVPTVAPADPEHGDQYFDEDADTLYTWIVIEDDEDTADVDESSESWVGEVLPTAEYTPTLRDVLKQYFDEATDTLYTVEAYSLYRDEIITVDLTNTYNYLLELGEDYLESEELTGHLEMLEFLKPVEDDPATADVDETKAAGIYVGPLEDIALLQVFSDTPFDGSASEPFTGATNDTWNLVAAFEELYFEYVPLIPTVTRSSATIYAENVVITWPAYSSAFGWGALRYRYLDTDPDFE